MNDTNFDYKKMDEEERPFARRLAQWIDLRWSGPVVDLGAGTGVYVEELRARGIRSQGYDVTWPQPRSDLVRRMDLTDVYDPAPVVVCLEVAEHIPTDQSEQVMISMWRNCLPGGWVVWSAAQPGQGGVGHINCQGPEYWTYHAQQVGFRRRWDTEADLDAFIIQGAYMGWFKNNRQIWQRPV